jgi:hypothetical protein
MTLKRTTTSAAIAATLLLASTSCPATSVTTGIDAQAQLPYWQLSDESMSLRLVQRLPDQTRGFFMARGFAPEHAERIAQSCVFQTVFHNTSHTGQPSPLEYNLRDWVVHVDGRQQGLKTREDWAPEWQQLGAPQAARIAFEWALYPTQQTYRPGDYNWGMSIFGLAPGTRFNLEVVWRQHGSIHSELIRDVECAPDIHPETTGGMQ